MTGDSFFRAIPDDIRIPGGCDDCDAYQSFDSSQAPSYRITVHHDDTCPAYRAMNSGPRKAAS
jgi:hypothetical protein